VYAFFGPLCIKPVYSLLISTTPSPAHAIIFFTVFLNS